MYEGIVIPESVIAEAGRRLLEAAPNARVILFGSAARGELSEDSDLDFLVIERDVKNRHAEQLRLRRELRPLGVPVDVLVYSEAQVDEWGDVYGTVINAALTEGRVLAAA
jgi:predicted nucleotidyltransferase